LTALLQGLPDKEIAAVISDPAAAPQAYNELLPDVVLFGLGNAPAESLRAVTSIRNSHPSARVIIFTASQSEEHIYRAVQAGARGYLLTTAPVEQILACLEAVFRGQSWIPRVIGEALARRMAAPELTRREREVLFAMAEGKSNKEIGAGLHVSEGTVKVHMTHILEKLKVNGRTEALAAAAARGLVSLTFHPRASRAIAAPPALLSPAEAQKSPSPAP
jgi:two-component system NarL family response regulator